MSEHRFPFENGKKRNHRWIAIVVTMTAITGVSVGRPGKEATGKNGVGFFQKEIIACLTYPQLTHATVPWPFTACATSDSSLSWGSPDVPAPHRGPTVVSRPAPFTETLNHPLAVDSPQPALPQGTDSKRTVRPEGRGDDGGWGGGGVQLHCSRSHRPTGRTWWQWLSE